MSESFRLLSLKHQTPEDPANLVIGRVFAKLRRGQDVGRLGKPSSLIVIRQGKADFHSVHRHHTVGGQAPAPVQLQALKDGFDVLDFGCWAKRVKRQALGFVHQIVLGVGVHSWVPNLGNAFIFARFCLTTPHNNLAKG